MATKILEAKLVIDAQDKTAAALDSVVKHVGGAVKSIENFRKAQSRFAEARSKFVEAQKSVEGAARAMASAAKPTAALTATYNNAKRAVTQASRAFDAQKTAVLGAKHELEGYGVEVTHLGAAQQRLKREAAEATSALERQGKVAAREAAQAERRIVRRAEMGNLAGVGGLIVAHEAGHLARASFETYREFDKERRFQKAVMGLSDEEQQPLVEQAIHGGATSKYNDIQWLEAQRELAARGLKKDQILGLTPMGANLGQALDLTLPDAVKQMEGAIFGFKKNISTLDDAVASARQTADIQTKAAKISGMTPEDIKEVYKFGATPARMSGVSEQLLLAFGGISKKANMGGDESGVAFRALISAAQSPTSKAKEAMLANGLNFKNYQNSPDHIALDPFVANIAARYGVKLDKKSQAGLGRIFSDQKLLADPALFAPAVVHFLKGSLGGNDAKSLKSIAGAANRYRDASMNSVDVNRFIVDMMTKLAGNLQFANAVFGPKQGSRIATALGDPETFRHMVDELTNHSAGFAEKIATERMAGFDGAVSRFEGAMKNVETAIGRAWDNGGKGGALSALTDAAGSLVQRFAELDKTAVQVISGFGGIAAVAAGVKGTVSVGNLLTGGRLGGAAVVSSVLPWFALATGTAVIAAAETDFAREHPETLQPLIDNPNAGMIEGDLAVGQAILNQARQAPQEMNVTVEIKPAEGFWAKVTSLWVTPSDTRAVTATTTGSVGKSMPEARPSRGASGTW